MGNRDELEDLVGEQVLVTMMDRTEIAGELDSYDEDFTLTLIGDGGPHPDETFLGDMNIEFVNGRKTLNGSNIKSTEPWDRPYANEG